MCNSYISLLVLLSRGVYIIIIIIIIIIIVIIIIIMLSRCRLDGP